MNKMRRRWKVKKWNGQKYTSRRRARSCQKEMQREWIEIERCWNDARNKIKLKKEYEGKNEPNDRSKKKEKN